MQPSNKKISVYLIDDDPFEIEWMETELGKCSNSGTLISQSFTNPNHFLKHLNQSDSKGHIYIVDLQFLESKLSGLDILREIRRRDSRSFIIIRTNQTHSTFLEEALIHSTNVICIKSEDDAILRDAIESGRAKLSQTTSKPKVPDYIYMHKGLLAWSRRIPNILNSAISHIHVHGPSGTGKEVYVDLLAAQLDQSVPFVRVNCAAIPEAIMESELFGHVKGSFTGAMKDRRGYFTMADKGWLFLDEVSCLSRNMQAALLRVLENGSFYPVGSNSEKRVEVKIISATNEDLSDLVDAGKFRLDLYQRLCEMTITTPTLDLLVEELDDYIRHICLRLRGGPYQITDVLLEILKKIDWSEGESRELRNCLRTMTERHFNKILTPASLPHHLISKLKTPAPPLLEGFDDNVNHLLLENLETMFRSNPKISMRKIASQLKISRSTLKRRLQLAKDQGLISTELLKHLPSSS